MDRDELYRSHIGDAIGKIETYVRGLSFVAFEKDFLVQDAVIREFEVIGEAAKYLSDAFKIKHPGIQWREVTDMRNKLVHEYFDVDSELVWTAIEEDLPKLKRAVGR